MKEKGIYPMVIFVMNVKRRMKLTTEVVEQELVKIFMNIWIEDTYNKYKEEKAKLK